MCTTCGCHDHDHNHSHNHNHDHTHDHNNDNQSRTISIKQDLDIKNKKIAEKNRAFFKKNNIFVLNLLSSPGSGKTTLLEKTLSDLRNKINFAVIEGDLQTDNDKKRIAKYNIPVRQINTISSCHLDAQMIQKELLEFNIKNLQVLIIENVGNLVCPATFDLGESMKISLLSVTEGDDKPIKYPILFRETKLALITKTDLLPYVDFDVKQCHKYLRQVNPDIEIIELSSKTSEGMELWYNWLNTHLY